MAGGAPERDEIERCLLFGLLWHESGLSRDDLHRHLKVPLERLRRFEDAEEAPPWEVLYGIAGLGGLPLFMIPELRWFLQSVPRTTGAAPALGYHDEQEMRRVGTELVRLFIAERPDGRLAAAPPAPEAPEAAEPALPAAADLAEDRRLAEELWRPLSERSVLEWRDLPGERKELRSWALVELLCHESARRTAHDEDEAPGSTRFWAAERLADLAVRIASLIVQWPWEPMAHGLRDYAWAHLGHVRRAAGDLKGAEEAFHYADEHFARAGSYGPLDAARPFLLKALLRRDQDRPEDARALLQRAQDRATPDNGAPAVALAEIELRLGAADAAQAALEGALAAFAGASRVEPWWAALALRLAFALAARRAGEGRLAEGAALLERAAPLARAARSRPGAAALASAFVKLAAKGQLDPARAEALWNDFRTLTAPAGRPRPSETVQ
ncbi:MAG TPA: hypothetical protein VEG34_19470 [Thermoanaerobaculia bacterium]|nr:hypothetical protein [Thermoanaerobaculia bacterium]